jgi:hypothetical protein
VHVGEDRRPVEEPLLQVGLLGPVPARDQPGALVVRGRDEVLDLGALGRRDERPGLGALVQAVAERIRSARLPISATRSSCSASSTISRAPAEQT